MIVYGLGGVTLALFLGTCAVAATVRADARLPADRTSGFVGLPRVLALAAVLVAVASVLVLAGAVFGGDAAVTSP